ncbi:MAG TPA: hypothetical protein P5524_02100 [Candidatus Paceibacterota bacterium]|nr:hypothetical protein [Candidatus Paceibacterota bacterium]
MKKNLIGYLLLPKGIRSILFKSYVYFVPFLYSLFLGSRYLQNFLVFLLVFFLFEFVINPSRYQLNDLADYKDDQRRQYHWQRPVNKDNGSLIFAVALSRFVLGTSVAFFLDINLGYLAIAFLALQLFYDHFAKRYSPFLAIFTVSIAYPLRSLTMFYGLDMALDRTSILLLLSILFYSTYMVIQWRKNESFFIAKNKLTPKPHSEFFSSPKVKFLIFPVLLMFLFIFIHLVVSLTKVSVNDALMIYAIALLLIIVFSLPGKRILNEIAIQSHNIIIAFLFTILTLNKFLITLAIVVVAIFIIFWYHKIYVEKFANNYFHETHHGEK